MSVIHFHGTPITPARKMDEMAGRNFCVSFAAGYQVERAHAIGQSVMLDNGAFSFWRNGMEVTPEWWRGYYDWAAPWLDYRTTWAVIPDVIEGDEAANDALIREWPFGEAGAPVWHLHESIARLLLLADTWPRICFGSSGLYANPGSDAWRHRVDEAFNHLCGNGAPPVWVHMLRAMEQACTGPWPFASADSTNAAQNHHRHASPVAIAEEWDARQAPPRWTMREQLELTTRAAA